MATYIKTLSDINGNVILPKTRSNAVYMGDNTTVEDKITRMNNTISAITLKSLSFIGTNPISTVADDTTQNWAAKNTGYAWYNLQNQITDQPGQYGFLIQWVMSSDVFQMWKGQSSGGIYIRGGNGSGWAYSWRLIFDASNIKNILNRTSAVNSANTDYSTVMTRGISISTSVPTSMLNGAVHLVYQ